MGEISYAFDSILNRTTATYVAPLGKDDFVHRILFARPIVHTITATYQFSGRIASHVPDTIRVLLESDDYIAATPEPQFVLVGERIMTVAVGERAMQHSLSVSERIELDSSPRGVDERALIRSANAGTIRLPYIQQVHVKRNATAWFSVCEFLSLINEHEVQGTVAGTRFKLNPKVVNGLALFAAEMLPLAAQNRSIDCGV